MDGDLSSLNSIALSLHKLQTIFGLIPNVRSKGLGAKKVLQKLLRMRVEEEDSDQQQAQQSAYAGSSSSSGGGASNEKYNQRSEIDTLLM